jgi:four helix bundle protein
MKKQLEKRLVDLALEINEICKNLDKSYLSFHLTKQIIRSSTSAALNYGEAQVAESRKDFIHKIGIVLKELKETSINLLMLKKTASNRVSSKVKTCEIECNQLIAVFQKTIITARKNIK